MIDKKQDLIIAEKELLKSSEYELLTCWGKKYENYLRKKEPKKYFALFESEKLFQHIVEKDKIINESYAKVVAGMAKKSGVDEKLREEKYLIWLEEMKTIHKKVESMFNSLLE